MHERPTYFAFVRCEAQQRNLESIDAEQNHTHVTQAPQLDELERLQGRQPNSPPAIAGVKISLQQASRRSVLEQAASVVGPWWLRFAAAHAVKIEGVLDSAR